MVFRPFMSTLLLALLATPLAAQSSTDHALAAQVDSIATDILESTGVPSASVAVVTHGRLAYAQAYGAATLEPRVAATPDMRYAVGSVSKQFAAAAVLLLQQDGKLSLDDHVSRWVKGLTDGDHVTIRELLSHTSGYQDFWPQDYVMPPMQHAVTPQAILDHWAKQPLDFAPGTRWQYSNTNFTLAAVIVEKASGKPFFEFVRSRILKPLGIDRAVDFDAGGPPSIEPVGYMRYALGPLRVAIPTGPGWMYGAGELALTPRDLARWDISLIDQSLLTPASYHALETEVELADGAGTGYALGVGVQMQNGRRVLGHSGEVAGFTAQNIVYPDDSAAVIVLTNQDAAPAAGAIAGAIGRLLFTTGDSTVARRTELARRIFAGLQKGEIDRSLFTANANAYFDAQGLADMQSSLGPLGATESFVQVAEEPRGGMLERVYRVQAGNRQLRVWTYEMPDGKLEQYQIAPIAQ